METKTAKPNAVSAQLPETLYCISCEEMVKAEQGERGLQHPVGDWKEEPTFCRFPMGYTLCPPPEADEREYNALEAIEVGEDFFNGDWAAQDSLDEFCPDEVGMWED